MSDKSQEEGNKEYKEGYDIARNADFTMRWAAHEFGGRNKDTAFGKGFHQGQEDRLKYGPQSDGTPDDTGSSGAAGLSSASQTRLSATEASEIRDSGSSSYSATSYSNTSSREGVFLGTLGIVGVLAIVGYFAFSLWYAFEVQIRPGKLDPTMIDSGGEILLLIATIPAVLATVAVILAVGIPLAVVIIIFKVLVEILF